MNSYKNSAGNGKNLKVFACREKWTDINRERFFQNCFTVSEAMIRLRRHHPSVLPENDGAVRFDEIMRGF